MTYKAEGENELGLLSATSSKQHYELGPRVTAGYRHTYPAGTPNSEDVWVLDFSFLLVKMHGPGLAQQMRKASLSSTQEIWYSS